MDSKLVTNLADGISTLNQKYKNIDWGGCGTFSYYLSEKLNNMGINNEIVYVPELNPPENCYRCDVKFEHFLVKVDDTLIDNRGFHSISNFSYRNINETYPLDKDKLREMLEDKKLWNNTFPHENWTYLAYDIINMKL